MNSRTVGCAKATTLVSGAPFSAGGALVLFLLVPPCEPLVFQSLGLGM